MILKLYRGHDPGTILIILLTGFLVWLQPLLNPAEASFIYNTNPMPLYGLLRNLLEGRLLAGTLVSFIFSLFIGFYLVGFNTRMFFINERTFLPAAIFILLSGFFPTLQSLNPVYPAALLVIIAVDRIVGSYRKQGIAYNFFDASLMIGVASLLYFNAIWCFIVVIAGIILLRTLNLREMALSVTGLITPYAVVVAWYYLAGYDLNLLSETIRVNISGSSPEYLWEPAMVIVSGITGLIVLISIIHLWSVFNTKKVRSRKSFSILMWLMVSTILSYIILPSVSVEMFHILLIPITYFLTHYMVFKGNKKIANAIFAIIFILVLILQIYRVSI